MDWVGAVACRYVMLGWSRFAASAPTWAMRRPRRPVSEPGVSEQRKNGHVYLQWERANPRGSSVSNPIPDRATFEHARDVNVFTGRGRQSGQLKLVHIVWNGQRGTVHLFGELFGRQIPDKLPGLRGVSDTVLPGDRSKSQDRRIIVEGVEKAVRS